DEARWIGEYKGRKITLSNGTAIDLSEAVVQKAAVKYGKAIALAISLGRSIEQSARKRNQPYEIELSVDETPQPTTLAGHYVIAQQFRNAGMKLVSLAPRFIGDFEKGVDDKGDLKAFDQALADHAAIARVLWPYKLSLHSGWEMLSIYPS